MTAFFAQSILLRAGPPSQESRGRLEAYAVRQLRGIATLRVRPAPHASRSGSPQFWVSMAPISTTLECPGPLTVKHPERVARLHVIRRDSALPQTGVGRTLPIVRIRLGGHGRRAVGTPGLRHRDLRSKSGRCTPLHFPGGDLITSAITRESLEAPGLAKVLIKSTEVSLGSTSSAGSTLGFGSLHTSPLSAGRGETCVLQDVLPDGAEDQLHELGG